MRYLLITSVILAIAALATSINPKKRSPRKDEQDLSKVPGTPGVDYPLFRSVPPTSFHCGNVPYAPGMYANVETGCQAYHVCHDGREGEQGASFLCPNGTLFNQHEFACDWWYNVNCGDAPRLYDLNLDPSKNPYFPKKKPEEELLGHEYHQAGPQYQVVGHVPQQYHQVAQPVHYH